MNAEWCISDSSERGVYCVMRVGVDRFEAGYCDDCPCEIIAVEYDITTSRRCAACGSHDCGSSGTTRDDLLAAFARTLFQRPDVTSAQSNICDDRRIGTVL